MSKTRIDLIWSMYCLSVIDFLYRVNYLEGTEPILEIRHVSCNYNQSSLPYLEIPRDILIYSNISPHSHVTLGESHKSKVVSQRSTIPSSNNGQRVADSVVGVEAGKVAHARW